MSEERTKELADFKLFSGCLTDLMVAELPDEARELGLDEWEIQKVVEGRMRAANVYDPKVWFSHLIVDVRVIGNAAEFNLIFRKWVTDHVSGQSAFATTWESGYLGNIRAGNLEAGQEIMNGLSDLTDEFLRGFLQANDSMCLERHTR